MNLKLLLFYILLLVLKLNLTAQIQDKELKNRHSIGISLLPLAETLLIENSYNIIGYYAYIFKPSMVGFSSASYFNRGKESYGSILGVGAGSNFNVSGGQLKAGIRWFTNYHKVKDDGIMICNFWGFAGAVSMHNFQFDILLTDEFNYRKYIPTNINSISKSFEMQFGKVVKLSNKLSLASYFSLGIIAKNEVVLPITRVPAIGSIGNGNISGYLNFSIDLFYNLNK